MSINSRRAANKVVSQLNRIGIDEKVGESESHTAELVRIIVEAVLFEIRAHGQVIITDATATTSTGPAPVFGKGTII